MAKNHVNDRTHSVNPDLATGSDRDTSHVSTPVGLYQPTVMPFGVKNAPGSFQREMRRVLNDRLNKGVFVFIDDIIVYSRTESEHLQLIDWVLSRLEAEGYYAHPGKCQFLRSGGG